MVTECGVVTGMRNDSGVVGKARAVQSDRLTKRSQSADAGDTGTTHTRSKIPKSIGQSTDSSLSSSPV